MANKEDTVTLVLPQDFTAIDRKLVRVVVARSRKPRILLDVSNLERIDDRLLRLLVELDPKLFRSGKTLRLVGYSESMEEALEAANMLEFLEPYQATALHAL
jgi:anti-anti-sigma regulatory factor